MASVRLTQDLQSRIIRKAAAGFDTPIQAAQGTLSPTFGDRCHAYVLRKYLKIMEQLPKDFFEQETRSRFTLSNFEGKSEQVYLDFTVDRPIPKRYTTYRDDMKVDQSSLYDEYMLTEEKVKAVQAERSNVEQLIKSGFNNATTLKKLLEMIPEIEMFIPESELRTHYEKVTPKGRTHVERVKVEANQDQKVAMAKLKMMGAMNPGDSS